MKTAVLCLVVLFCLPGCDTGYKIKRTAKGVYRSYIEPAPKVDLRTADLGEDDERELARLLKPVDERVNALLKYIDGEDAEVKDEWFQKLFERFPWVGGAFVLDAEAKVKFQHPQDARHTVDVAQLLDLGMKDPQKPWGDHKMRAASSSSALGPEIYLAQPYFKDNVFKGLNVVHFDPRNLLEFHPEPDGLMMLTPGQIIWTAAFHDAAATLAAAPWQEIMQDDLYGKWEGAEGAFYWMGRHFGHFHLIYAAAARPR